ncbi:SRF-TF-domain-containing protein, partial [Tilletiopsis washingtonensis]
MGSTGSANSHEHEYDDDDFLGGGGGASSSAAQQQRQSGKSESVDDVEGEEEEDDSDDDAPAKSKRKRARTNTAASANGADGKSERDNATGRRKIRIEFIEDDSRRHITFSKRKAGIMKKAYELATLTGTQVLLLVVSQTGLVYTFTTPKLAPVVKENAGKELIRRCLESDE